MRLFGILLIFFIILAGGGYVYLATQDLKGRQQINAAGLRHLLLLQGFPLEGPDFAPDDETPFEVRLAGGESTKTVSKKLLEKYFSENTAGGAAPATAEPAAGKVALAANTPVTNQQAEVKRVLGLLRAEVEKAKDAPPAQRTALAAGWVLLQAETMNERIWYQTLIAANDADSLLHALDLKFYRVAPKLYDSPDAALAPARWQELQKLLADAAATPAPAAGDGEELLRAAGGLQDGIAASLKPRGATDAAERRARLAHLLVHLDRDAAWQKRVAVVVGLQKYVQAIATQAGRFREMRDQVDLPIAADQASFQKNQDFWLNEARQQTERARVTAEERSKLESQEVAARGAVTQRETQLGLLAADLKKLKSEVDELLLQQTGTEKDLYEIQREVGLTLEQVYRLEALLIDIERERYGHLPRTRP